MTGGSEAKHRGKQEENPFLLVPDPDAGHPGAPPKDIVARLARVLSAARDETTLAAPIRAVTAAWLDEEGWRVGLAVLRAEDGSAIASALAVADRDGVDAWRDAVGESDAKALASLLEGSESTLSSEQLPPPMAALAAERTLDRCDRFPIEAGDRVVAAVLLLRAEEAAPSSPVRAGMEVAREILCQIASRIRAHDAVAVAARHIRELSKRVSTDGDSERAETRARTDRTARDLMYDGLTGLPTAAMLLDRIEQAMRRRVRRPDRSFAVLAISLDGLGESADRLGREAAEELQLAVSRRIANAVRPGDTVAHLEDRRFGLVLDDVKTLDDATRVTRRVIEVLSPAIPLGSESIRLSPAIGLALSRTAYETPSEMIRDAGIALRRARREDSSIQVFDAATKAFAQGVSELEGDLREAFEARELFLEYQPVVSLGDGRITGVEAFLRWNHRERGAIPPSEFIPVAEEAGLLHELGYWVMDRACRQMKDWIEAHGLRFPPNIAINVTESQLFEESFVARSIETIEGSGLPAKLVRLDVSEGTFMKDGPAAARILEALTARGLRVAVDDFGTGYSSLSYLHRYPIGALKIDRSFVSGAAGAGNEWDVARTIIELAKVLELEVIAEGIETREQFQHLRSLGCQQAQGYFFSGPVAAAQAGALIASGYPLDMASPKR
ncbi:MAG: phosphodiesterase [Gemmatimonadetes bacterium]|nr:phosphodiesterase [Gemmatimonadota bacterium]